MRNLSPLVLLLVVLFGVNANARTTTRGTESFTGYQEFRGIVFDRLNINGAADFKNVKFVNGTITGDLDFEELVVDKNLEVHGHVFGNNATFQNLHAVGSVRLSDSTMNYLSVTGPTSLKNCAVKKNANITGFFKARNSVIGHIDISGNTIILYDSKVGSIRIKKTSSLDQKLILNNSSVKDVIFESGNGQIAVIGNAEILGKIVGGIVSDKVADTVITQEKQ